MSLLADMLARNAEWAEQTRRQDPEFFRTQSQGQHPEYLWIGCSDSRVPPETILALPPGSMFVHRNIANLVVQPDTSCLSVLQYAVQVLRVKHIIVCGHASCGGVKASGRPTSGSIDNWLHHIREVAEKHREALAAVKDESRRVDLLCQLNVIEQAIHAGCNRIVQEAWEHGQDLTIHGWFYELSEGRLRDLDLCLHSADGIEDVYAHAVARLTP